MPVAGAGRPQVGMGALHEHVALVLSQSAQYLEHELPAGRSRVNRVLQGYQVQLAAAKVFDHLNQVLGGAAQPVEPPDDDGVAGSSIDQQFLPNGLVGLRPRDGIGEQVLAIGLAQSIELQVQYSTCSQVLTRA